jgi:hypothetical protein
MPDYGSSQKPKQVTRKKPDKKVVVINVPQLRSAVHILQMDVICKDEQTFVRKHHVLILRLWAALAGSQRPRPRCKR